MKRFRTSEILFLTVGILLILSSSIFLLDNISLVKFFSLRTSAGDPFEASYYSETSGTTTPEENREANPTPAAPILQDSAEIGIFLKAPQNQELVHRLAHSPTPQTLHFRFEVYPKHTDCSFTLYFKNQVIVHTALAGGPGVSYELPVPMPGPGVYQWQIKAGDITSELRSFTVQGDFIKKTN